MVENKDKKVLNVPNLRFPEFEGEWEEERLGNECNIQMCKRIMAAQTNTECGVPSPTIAPSLRAIMRSL